jgi:hypothetical protein
MMRESALADATMWRVSDLGAESVLFNTRRRASEGWWGQVGGLPRRTDSHLM